MVITIVTPNADQLSNGSCARSRIDFVPPKGRRWPSLCWNAFLVSEPEIAEILVSAMPDGDAMRVGLFVALGFMWLMRSGQIRIDRIKGGQGREYLRVKLQL